MNNKKLLSILFFSIFLLTACTKTEVNIKEDLQEETIQKSVYEDDGIVVLINPVPESNGLIYGGFEKDGFIKMNLTVNQATENKANVKLIMNTKETLDNISVKILLNGAELANGKQEWNTYIDNRLAVIYNLTFTKTEEQGWINITLKNNQNQQQINSLKINTTNIYR